jgi:hypothetical protein
MRAVFETKQSGRNLRVMRNGVCVYGPVTHRADAENMRDKLERTDGHKRRKCMTCGDPFMSEGAHHRMCTKCRSGAIAIFDGAV